MTDHTDTLMLKVAAVIASATEGARIELIRRRNWEDGATCFTVGIGSGCVEDCPVRQDVDCEHDDQKGQP